MLRNSITISERDMRRLSTLLDTSMTYRYPRESAWLSEVLAHASVAPDANVPRAVVTMGATAVCRIDDDRAIEVSLGYPWDAETEAGTISVLSSLGVTLLGLEPGNDVEWTDEQGTSHTLHVFEVAPSRAG